MGQQSAPAPAFAPVGIRPHADLACSSGRLAGAVARLCVRHWPAPSADLQPAAPLGEALSIQTCQRTLHVSLLANPHASPSSERRDLSGQDGRGEIHRGAAAYRLLLEVAAGLKSEIPGETNVFGQVREAWRQYSLRQSGSAVRALSTIMQALFRDVRQVRTRHLQGIGGQSYATLARRLLAPAADARVLIVGYGELGRSMPQKFSRGELAVFNRTLPQTLPGPAVRSFGAGDELQAALWATHVVMCVPREPGIDARWIGALRGRESVRVAHLGCRRGDRGEWDQIRDLFDLDDLFDLQRAQAQLRAGQLDAARAACARLAARAVSGALI